MKKRSYEKSENQEKKKGEKIKKIKNEKCSDEQQMKPKKKISFSLYKSLFTKSTK
ncbi:MAG: hypothetical protein PG977_001300 [Bartonella clarridgeiae]|nr:MAG: hypothetical protein PG977_001300 [Bartonella clarridgeiae]